MILGDFGAGPAERTPFSPPPTFYQPRMPRTGFPAGFTPMRQVLPRFPPGYQPRIDNSPLAYYGQRTRVPQVPQPAAPPLPGPVAGAFGRSPVYDVMRQGLIRRVHANAGNVMVGVRSAPQLIRQLTPSGYTNVNLPAGGYY
jgi:hypothetical protein